VSLVSPHNGQRARFPRSLSPFESQSLLWVLPPDRPGYHSYRKYILDWQVLAEGRRGPGNYILGDRGIVPDIDSPLPQVFAYGMIEGESENVSVTLREFLEGQLEYEIVNLNGETIPAGFAERRRWTFSLWFPSDPCPACGTLPREVKIQREAGAYAVLAVCRKDKRIWIFDERDGVNHLIPVTNFHNALMLQKNIRDPEIALAADNLFKFLNDYSDADLAAAFVRYNALRRKVDLGKVVLALPRRESIFKSMLTLFRR
jgi:hypothetical protein